MTSKLSLHAQRSLERLQESFTVNMMIRSDVKRHDQNLPSNAPNAPFNRAFDMYFGALQVCHAADILNSYCQSILSEIVAINQQVFTTFQKLQKGRSKQTREELIERLKGHKEGDGAVRKFLQDELQCQWSPESDIICAIRNKFVHQSGHDPEHEIESLILSKNGKWSDIPPSELPPGFLPVGYSNKEWLDANSTLGEWACLHVRNHIHLMDQNLCFTYSLSRDTWRPRPISRQFALNPIVNQPATNLPSTVHSNLSQTTTVFAAKKALVAQQPSQGCQSIPYPSSQEIQCAHEMRRLLQELRTFVDAYAKKAGASVQRLHAHIIPLSFNTVKGSEDCLEYDLVPNDSSQDSKEDRFCIRIREKDFNPFVMVWSSKLSMKEFSASESEALKQYIQVAIDRVITG